MHRHFPFFWKTRRQKAEEAAALKAAEEKARREAESKARRQAAMRSYKEYMEEKRKEKEEEERREAEERERLEREAQQLAWEEAHCCEAYYRWTTCYDSDAFNLPLDTIYYIESEWDVAQNHFMRCHIKEVEAYINEYMLGEEPLFPYKMVYVARDNHSLMEQLRPLYPSLRDLEDAEQPKQTPKRAGAMKVSLMTRIYGAGYCFLEMDCVCIEPERMLSAICDYVDELGRVNRAYVFYNIENRDYSRRVTECSFIAELGKKPLCLPFEEKHNLSDSNPKFCLEDAGLEFRLRIHNIEREIISSSRDRYQELSEQLANARAEYEQFRREEAEERRREEDEQRRKEEEERQRKEEARARALAIKAEIEALQRDNGITILTEILGKPLLDSLRADQPVTTSTLRVDSQYRILLPEYDIEVEMTTLPKALYLLFLRHPEGIEYKMMDEYREELRVIYLTISSRSNVEEMQKSINDLVEPGSDSLLQKVSRINAAFRRHLADEVAAPYMIQGPRGEAKRIRIAGEATLPDDLRF